MKQSLLWKMLFADLVLAVITFSVGGTGYVFIFCLFALIAFSLVTVLSFYLSFVRYQKQIE